MSSVFLVIVMYILRFDIETRSCCDAWLLTTYLVSVTSMSTLFADMLQIETLHFATHTICKEK